MNPDSSDNTFFPFSSFDCISFHFIFVKIIIYLSLIHISEPTRPY